MSNVNENIRNFRKFRGLSQKELGQKVNKSTNVVSNWENGLHSPDLDTIQELCKILKVTPNQIFGWEECPEYIAWINEQTKIMVEIDRMNDQKKALEDRIAAYAAKLAKVSKDKENK